MNKNRKTNVNAKLLSSAPNINSNEGNKKKWNRLGDRQQNTRQTNGQTEQTHLDYSWSQLIKDFPAVCTFQKQVKWKNITLNIKIQKNLRNRQNIYKKNKIRDLQ